MCSQGAAPGGSASLQAQPCPRDTQPIAQARIQPHCAPSELQNPGPSKCKQCLILHSPAQPAQHCSLGKPFRSTVLGSECSQPFRSTGEGRHSLLDPAESLWGWGEQGRDGAEAGLLMVWLLMVLLQPSCAGLQDVPALGISFSDPHPPPPQLCHHHRHSSVARTPQHDSLCHRSSLQRKIPALHLPGQGMNSSAALCICTVQLKIGTAALGCFPPQALHTPACSCCCQDPLRAHSRLWLLSPCPAAQHSLGNAH